MIDHDLLLEWVSERGSGSWADLRGAIEWLGSTLPSSEERPSAAKVVLVLASLGHLEMDWTQDRWAAAPPVLTILPYAGSHALLTGGRTRSLVDKLDALTSDDEDLYVFQMSQDAPSAVYVAARDEAVVESLADALGIAYDHSVADRLSQILPSMDLILDLAGESIPSRGFGVKRFLLGGGLGWKEVTSDREAGLYEYPEWGRNQYRWVDRAGRYRIIDKYMGIYAELHRLHRNVLKLRMEGLTGDLLVPVYAPLPSLHARAAAMCSGLGPDLIRGSGVRCYVNVPQVVAERIARSLGQSLDMQEAKVPVSYVPAARRVPYLKLASPHAPPPRGASARRKQR